MSTEFKVIVVGLDGATWDVILPFVKEGRLPTFKKLIENGSWGILKSTYPPVTVPAWPSFATGKNPGKLGVYNFLIVDTKTGKTRIVRSTDIKSKKIWNYLDVYDKSSIIINHPVTYPPEEINGIMISGMLTPPNSKDYTYPLELSKELEKLRYIIETDPDIVENKWDTEMFINEILKTIQKRTEVVLYFMEKYSWDFLFVLYRATDIVQHKQFQNKEKLLVVYQEIDKSLEKILKNLPQNSILILMSDHGFCDFKKKFNISKWLYEKGYLRVKKSEAAHKSILAKIGITRSFVLSILHNLHLEWVQRYIPATLRSFLPRASVEFDLKESLVYPGILFTGASQYLTINKEKIETYEEYHRVQNELISDLLNLRDPETEKTIMESIYKKEDIYNGEYLDSAPDIVFLLKKGYGLSTLLNLNGPVIEKVYKPFGTHHIDGIFLAYGNGIKKNYKFGQANIIDIAPTILHIFNLPIPDDIDGKVIIEIFDEKSEFRKKEPTYVHPKYYEEKIERIKIKRSIKKLKLNGRI